MPHTTAIRRPGPGRPEIGVRATAVALGCSEAAIYKWTREGRIAKDPITGRYDPEACRAQLERWSAERRAMGLANEVLLQELSKLRMVQRQVAEFQLERLRASVVDREEVEQAIAAVFAFVRREVLAEADAIAAELAGLAAARRLSSVQDLRRVIRRHSEDLLSRIANATVVEAKGPVGPLSG